ncbi:MAG: acyl-CoA thioesterase [Gammaproteobacteria bacterium]
MSADNMEKYFVDQIVRVTDLNYGNHVGVSQMSGMAHQARFAYLNSMGLSESDIGGVAIMVLESTICMKAESFLGDLLRFYVEFQRVSKSQCVCNVFVFNLVKDVLVATVEDKIIAYDYQRRRPSALPETFI